MAQDRKASKKATYTADEWIARMQSDLSKDYQIGLHQVGVFGTKESIRQVRKNDISTYFRTIKPEDFCKSIVKSGLKNRWENIGNTLSTFGSVEEIANNKSFRKEAFLQYDYNNDGMDSEYITPENLYDVIVAMPLDVYVRGNEYHLGHLEYPEDEKYRTEKQCELFNRKSIPKEFIYGYIHKYGDKIDFTPNAAHFSKMSKEEQEAFIEGFVQQVGIDIKSLQADLQDAKTSKIADLSGLVKKDPTLDELEISVTSKKVEPQGIE